MSPKQARTLRNATRCQTRAPSSALCGNNRAGSGAPKHAPGPRARSRAPCSPWAILWERVYFATNHGQNPPVPPKMTNERKFQLNSLTSCLYTSLSLSPPRSSILVYPISSLHGLCPHTQDASFRQPHSRPQAAQCREFLQKTPSPRCKEK